VLSMNQRRFLRLMLSLNLAIPLSHHALGRDDGDGENTPPVQQKSVWVSGFASGLEQSQVTQKPLLVVFGAEWCSWCRKLELELASEAASTVRDEWTLAKVDVDEEEELASKYGVQALPTIVVVDTTGSKMESVEGYMPMDQLAGWLADQKAGAVSVLDAALQESADANDENIAKWVSFLGDRKSSTRQIAKQKILQHRSKTWTAILPVLEQGSLAQRLSAMEILEKWKTPSQQLDPWHPESFQPDSIQAIRKWLEENSVSTEKDINDSSDGNKPNAALKSSPSEPGDKERAFDSPLPEEIAKHIDKWRSAHDDNVELLLAETFSLSDEKEVIRGFKKLILDSELGDQEKTNARFAYYNLLAGATIRSEHLGLLKSLAGFDDAKRRRAGVALAQKLTVDDSRLLHALIEDQDSVIREASVEVIAKVDSNNVANWLERLLRDPDRNVRGMSLKTLAPSLSTTAFPIVAKYLPTENDENLIVQGFKFLSSQTNYNLEKEYLGLIPFLEHEQWRIRAEATEFLGKQIHNQIAYQRARDDSLTTPIIEGLSSRLLDPDSFVKAKVQEYIPYLVNAKTLPKLAKLLIQNVELLDRVLESTESSRSRSVYLGIGGQVDENDNTADLLMGLNSSDADVRLVSAIFLTDSKPERALNELAKHVATESPLLKSRIVDHAIRAFNNYRDESTSAYLHGNTLKEGIMQRGGVGQTPDAGNRGLSLFDLFTGSVKQSVERSDQQEEEEDLFGIVEIKPPGLDASKPETLSSKDSKNSKPTKKPRNFKEWMEDWNNEESFHETKVNWKLIASQWLQSQDTDERKLGLILSPIVGLPVDQKEWLTLFRDDKIKATATSVVGWLPLEWSESIGDSWEPTDKKLNQVFLKSVTSAVEPKRLMWLVNNKDRFVSDYTDANTLLNACLRTILGSGIRFGEYNTHFGNYFTLDNASDDVRAVVEELFAKVKRDDDTSAFAMAVLLQLVPKETESLCMELLDSESTNLQTIAAYSLLGKSSFANAKLLNTIREKGSSHLDRWILNYLWGNTVENRYSDMMLIYGGTRSTQQTDELVRFLRTARRGTAWKDWLKLQIDRNAPEAEAYVALMRIALEPDAPIELLDRYPGNSGSQQSLNLILTAVVASTREDAAAWLVEHFEKLKATSQNEYLNSYSWVELIKSRKGEWIKLKKILEDNRY
jgi:thioredoxin-related protein/HEAT repeat protein